MDHHSKNWVTKYLFFCQFFFFFKQAIKKINHEDLEINWTTFLFEEFDKTNSEKFLCENFLKRDKKISYMFINGVNFITVKK